MSLVAQLQTRMVEKVWGRDVLPAPFAPPADTRIGEIWFEPPPALDSLLVKYLFTSEKLSVQVHPSSADALPGEAGKEECWLVLDAQPDARLAIGFDQKIVPEDIAAAARDGSIEGLLTWHQARAGDIFYLPAGTVHAIGPGLALVEVQQNSETTFRLFDYGRPRELHLDRAIAVAKGEPYPAHHKSSMEERGRTLVDGPHFRIDRIEGAPDEAALATFDGDMLVLPLQGEVHARKGLGTRTDSGEPRALPGDCLYAPTIGSIDFDLAQVTLLISPR
jgi:mannose-6-phosphate isomerase